MDEIEEARKAGIDSAVTWAGDDHVSCARSAAREAIRAFLAKLGETCVILPRPKDMTFAQAATYRLATDLALRPKRLSDDAEERYAKALCAAKEALEWDAAAPPVGG